MVVTSQILLHSFLFLCLFGICACHSYLRQPAPYSSPANGSRVCPDDDRPQGEIDATLKRARIYRRGQVTSIKWTKNNHNGGFVQFSFVNYLDRFNATAHEHFAFYHGCWEQGRYHCTGDDCGTDKRGAAFRRTITIPDNIPDGLYTFALNWYGGVLFNRKLGKFPDWVSCAYVRIRGGVPLKKSFQPYFSAGDTGKYKHKGMCLTSSIEPGECLNGCPNKPAFHDISKDFKDGKKPVPILASEYSEGEKRPTPSKNPAPSKESQPTTFICNDKLKTCCSGSCAKCEQEDCASREGGEANCCPHYIRSYSGRICSKSSAPCAYEK